MTSSVALNLFSLPVYMWIWMMSYKYQLYTLRDTLVSPSSFIVVLKMYNVDICHVTPVMHIFSKEILLKPCFYGLLLLQAPTCGPSSVLWNNKSWYYFGQPGSLST